MADDSDLEKTEQASSKRLDKAREDGDVPRSRELATFSVLMSAALCFWLTGDAMVRQLKLVLVSGLKFDMTTVLDPNQLGSQWSRQVIDLLIVFSPLGLLLVIAAVGSPMLVGGFVFSAKSLTPNFEKLNPLQGLGKMLSLNALTELLKAIAKTTVVASAAWFVMSTQTNAVFSLPGLTPTTAIAEHGRLLLLFFFILAGALSVIAFVDAPYQMWQHSKKMMMTRQQVKDESKESEGNPEIKAKIRAQQRVMARRRMMSQVPNADVVVTNPTHYAVALKYPENAGHAPLVVAKGSGELAGKIREIALLNRIVILESPALARTLFKYTEISDEIPPALYTAVAQVLAYVFQLRDYKTHGGLMPIRPEEIEVPAGMDPLVK